MQTNIRISPLFSRERLGAAEGFGRPPRLPAGAHRGWLQGHPVRLRRGGGVQQRGGDPAVDVQHQGG